MDIKSKVFDVSSFLLFEATGDSEAGFFDPAVSVVNHAEEDDNDDAESCSCDTTSDFLPGVRELDSLENKLANVGDDDHHEDEEDGEVVEQEEVHLYKKCRDDQRINGVVAKEKKLSAVSVDSTKTMNEMEKNRLFWEACLAS
ncbi:uncharacterized protein LOC111314187 [Durio zibethinus]|uniref:Uncharacterized protein LOC111314187 n=1 Tax=Durio zibethinus TaxID=66656 RepID=A0A6P6B1Y4_DURZI|nr:uncharacterized protein LOC111314187 [Durio zibethinus]